jgi:hypothetical protein
MPEHDGDRAQAAHDAADAERVADRLLEAVALGDLEVAHRAGAVAGHLDHAQDVVGAVEGALALDRRRVRAPGLGCRP